MGTDMEKYSEYAAMLNQCDKELDDIYHDYALRHHLSDAALWIFYVLYDAQEGVTQAAICDSWFFSRQTINTALKHMEQQGAIEFAALPGNRKSKQVVLTASGRTMAERVVVPMKKIETQVSASFSDKENRLLVELTQKRCSLLRKFMENEIEGSSEEL